MALVTGAGRGIGRAIALELARHGAKVVVNDVSLDRAQSVASEIASTGGHSLQIAADVSNETEVQDMICHSVDHFQRIDILINNAGVVSTRPLAEITSGEWDHILAINLKGVFLCTKAVFPLMQAQGKGSIVNIASAAGKRGGGMHGDSCYAAAKGGVIAFTKSVAREGGPYNVRVNAIAPALISTEMLGGLPGAQLSKIVEGLPLRRTGKAEEVASAACFLASEAASFMTGEIMDVDGGLMMD